MIGCTSCAQRKNQVNPIVVEQQPREIGGREFELRVDDENTDGDGHATAEHEFDMTIAVVRRGRAEFNAVESSVVGVDCCKNPQKHFKCGPNFALCDQPLKTRK